MLKKIFFLVLHSFVIQTYGNTTFLEANTLTFSKDFKPTDISEDCYITKQKKIKKQRPYWIVSKINAQLTENEFGGVNGASTSVRLQGGIEVFCNIKEDHKNSSSNILTKKIKNISFTHRKMPSWKTKVLTDKGHITGQISYIYGGDYNSKCKVSLVNHSYEYLCPDSGFNSIKDLQGVNVELNYIDVEYSHPIFSPKNKKIRKIISIKKKSL